MSYIISICIQIQLMNVELEWVNFYILALPKFLRYFKRCWIILPSFAWLGVWEKLDAVLFYHSHHHGCRNWPEAGKPRLARPGWPTAGRSARLTAAGMRGCGAQDKWLLAGWLTRLVRLHCSSCSKLLLSCKLALLWRSISTAAATAAARRSARTI